MAGRGASPKPAGQRRTRVVPTRGEVVKTPSIGWQHAPASPPDGLLAASKEAWDTWMASWVAAHWSPMDLPGLRTMILTFDQVQRGEFQRGPELRLLMDTYGITPKGQQDRRWAPPKADEPAKPEPSATPASDPRFAHLRAV